MTAKTPRPRIVVDALWGRQPAVRRPSPIPLDRDRIVSVAIELADGGGLAAVSLRSVAAALGAGPMRLYGYVTTKDELLELMVDRIHGEVVLIGPVKGSWQHATAAIAHRFREAALEHEWLVDLLGGRPHQGPGALAFIELWLASLDRDLAFADIDAVMDALRTLNAYVLGAVRNEVAERRAERDSGLDKAAWQAADAEHMAQVIATGRFPMIARVVSEVSHPAPDLIFERGLAAVLRGLAWRPSASAGHVQTDD